MMAFTRELYQAIFDNPLLRQRLAKSRAYTWSNLPLLAGVGIVALFSVLRGIEYVRIRSMISQFPEVVKNELLKSYQISAFEWDISKWGVWAFDDGVGIEALFWAHWGLAIILTWMLLAVLFARRFRRGVWDSPASDEMRVLPFEPRKILLARYDWPILKGSVCFWIAMAFFLLPGRIAMGIFLYAPLRSSVRYELLTFPAAITIWCCLLGIHRMTQRLWFDCFTIYKSRMTLAWLAWAILSLPAGILIARNEALRGYWMFFGLCCVQMAANTALLIGYSKARQELFAPVKEA